MVVSNIFYFHTYLGKISIFTSIFQRGWNHQPDKDIGKGYNWRGPRFGSRAQAKSGDVLGAQNAVFCAGSDDFVKFCLFLERPIWVQPLYDQLHPDVKTCQSPSLLYEMPIFQGTIGWCPGPSLPHRIWLVFSIGIVGDYNPKIPRCGRFI